MKITEKLKDVLSEADLASLESAIKEMVTEEAQRRAELIAEERIKKVEAIAEEYVQKEITQKTAELVESYDDKMNVLETKLCKALDTFLDSEISEKISDDLLEKIAINETLRPVVDGIKAIFSENSLELDTEGSKIVKKLQRKLEGAEKDLSESIQEKMTLTEKLEKVAVSNLISEKTDGLTDEQASRVKKMFEDKSFEDVEKSIDGIVDMVISEENSVENTVEDDDSQEEETVAAGDGIEEEKTILKEEVSSLKKITQRYL